MSDLLLWGATGQARVLRELVHGSDWNIVAIVDSRPLPAPFPGPAMLLGVSGLDVWLGQRGAFPPLAAAVAVGGDRGVDRLSVGDQLLARGIPLTTLVHSRAYVAQDATLAEGCQILVGAIVATQARLGRLVIVNTGASVDHDCCIGDGAHVGPGARLAGQIEVGPRSFIGTGALILPRIRIGADAIIGAGAVVTRDVADATVVVGNPARILRTRQPPA